MHEVTVSSPAGPLLLRASGDALVGLHFLAHKANEPAASLDAPTPLLAETARQLAEYFAGTRTAFALPLAPEGTAFQRRVWEALLEIPFGRTESYGELASRLGQFPAVRAVGAAIGRNPIAIVIPCHRVIGSTGRLVGFGGGLETKGFVLDLEKGGRLF